MDMHMDRAWDTFWIKSQNGTFIALQMKSFGSEKFQISSTGKKVPLWQFFRMGWVGHALLGRPSRIPQRNWKILFVLDAAEYIERLEGKVRECLFFYVKILYNNSVIEVLRMAGVLEKMQERFLFSQVFLNPNLLNENFLTNNNFPKTQCFYF